MLARAREHLGRAHPNLARQRGRDRLGPEHQLPVPGGLVLRQHLREPAARATSATARISARARSPAASALASPTRPTCDPFGTPGPCSARCTASSAKTNSVADGFAACYGYTHVVTVWRNFDVNTQYKICNKQNGQVPRGRGQQHVGRARRSSSAPTPRSTNQKWTITQISPGKYKVMNVNSGKALDISGGSIADNTALVQTERTRGRRPSSGRSSRWAPGYGGNYL